MKKFLVVVDVQNDFVTGNLGTKEAQAIIPNIVKKIQENKYDKIFVTQDVHEDFYLSTKEGKNLPVKHCISDTEGCFIEPNVLAALFNTQHIFIQKDTFGTEDLVECIADELPDDDLDAPFQIEFVGLCTDICVIANVVLVNTNFFENADVIVDASCCAGVTPEKHKAALEVMKSMQIKVIND